MTNEEKLKDLLGPSFYPHECGGMIECITKQDAMKAIFEAYNLGLETAAENADIKRILRNGSTYSARIVGFDGERFEIDKESILKHKL